MTLEVTATNHLRDTVTRSYYFDRATLAVHGEAEAIRVSATDGASNPTVRVSSRPGGQAILDLRFGTRLRAGRSLGLTVTFDLVDHGGAPDRELRVSSSLVLFRAWAFGTPETPGSSTTVVLPADYAVRIDRGPLTGPTVDPADPAGRQVFASGPLSAPLEFVADVAADRPGGYVEGRRSASVGETTVIVVVRSWPDDPAWHHRVSGLVLRALPALEAAVGAPLRLTGPLTVREALPGSGTGGATWDPATAELAVAYAADEATILRALAHAWFDGTLVADRWIAEGFAALAAETAAASLGLAYTSPELTPELAADLIPLNAWGPPGSVSDAQAAYAAAASLAIARAVAERAGPAAMAAVWAAAGDGIGAYPPPSGDPEPATGPPDWRGFLDLLEDATGTSFEDLWRRYVVRAEDTPDLRDRVAARSTYVESLDLARGWALPADLRSALRSWRFDAATDLAREVAATLARREAVIEAARQRGLAVPPTLRRAFEGPDGPRIARAEAVALLGTLGAIDRATAARPDGVDPVTRLGLLFETPEADLETARVAFEAGELDAAIAAAVAAELTWSVARDLGFERLLRLVVGGLALAVLAALAVRWLRQARRRRVIGAGAGRRPARR